MPPTEQTPSSERAAAPSDGQDSDADLLTRLRGDHEDALEELYRRHRQAVYWVADAILRSPEDAEEIVADAYLTLWTKRASVRPLAGSLLPWLLTTGRYLALNRQRLRARRSAVGGLPEDTTDPAPTPEGAILSQELKDALRVTLSGLADIDRDVLELCLMEGLTYKETAARLGVSHGAVRNRLARIRDGLRINLALLRGPR